MGRRPKPPPPPPPPPAPAPPPAPVAKTPIRQATAKSEVRTSRGLLSGIAQSMYRATSRNRRRSGGNKLGKGM